MIKVTRVAVIEYARSHWNFGKWLLGTQVIAVVNRQSSYWLLALFLSAAETGIFSACMNIILLSNPLMLGMSNILEPRLARGFAAGGGRELRRIVHKIAILMDAVMFVFTAALYFLGEWLIQLLYANPAYAGNGTMITVLAAANVLTAISMSAGLALRPLGRTDLGFWNKLFDLVVLIGATLLLITDYGLLGVAYAFLLTAVVDCVIRYALFHRELNKVSN